MEDESPTFYHPETGVEIQATSYTVECSNPNCIGYKEKIDLYDVGTGVFCGGCSSELVSPSPLGMVEVQNEPEEVPEWLL